MIRGLLLAGIVALCLAGCGAVNSYTGAALTAGTADYAGARTNVQKVDDMAFTAWSDSACDIKLGALARNNTGNANAVAAALKACPVPNPNKTLDATDIGTAK